MPALIITKKEKQYSVSFIQESKRRFLEDSAGTGLELIKYIKLDDTQQGAPSVRGLSVLMELDAHVSDSRRVTPPLEQLLLQIFMVGRESVK